ncbi:MAG: sugar ABC transporter permease [Caldilinea sp. CFX5]|nr:sugar ABC transporter permease [Caldilinea sp. CFX5]
MTTITLHQLARPKRTWKKRFPGLFQWLEALPYLLPTIIGFLVFILGPVIASFFLGFTEWDLLTPPKWIGLGNYRTMLFDTPLFWKTMSNTLYYTILFIPGGVILPLLVAVIMNQPLRGVTVYRSVYFLPVVTSTVAVALVWQWLYNPEFGPINYLLKLVGLKGPAWIASPEWAMPALVVMSVWQVVGYNMVIYLAGLQAIPEEYYEAAALDGASRWRQFFHITVPLISPTIFFVLIISLINALQVFEQTYILTQGGPAYATLSIAFYIYQQAFQFFHMGFGAALAYVLFVLILIVTLIQFRIQKRWVFYG